MNKVMCLIVLSVTGSALALTPLGPTTTTLRQGQWEFGAAYTNSEQDVAFEEGPKVDDAELESVLGRITVGLATNRAELFLLAGASNSDDLDTRTQFAVGIGTRVTTNSGDELTWGFVAEALRYKFNLDVGDLQLYEVQLGVGPTWRAGDFMLYGGPMVQFLFGHIDNDFGGDIDVDQDVYFGGYIGAGLTLFEHLTANVEGQLTTDSQGVSAGLNWRF